jgi:hypothetical protein
MGNTNLREIQHVVGRLHVIFREKILIYTGWNGKNSWIFGKKSKFSVARKNIHSLDISLKKIYFTICLYIFTKNNVFQCF